MSRLVKRGAYPLDSSLSSFADSTQLAALTELLPSLRVPQGRSSTRTSRRSSIVCCGVTTLARAASW